MAGLNAIETLGLSKRYRSQWVCRDIHLRVRRGEIFGFLGPNGAGKSTFVKMLMGLVAPTEGSARLLGRSFRDPDARRAVGYLPELFRYPPWLTAEEVLQFHAELLGHARIRCGELLDQVGLSEAASRRVRTFSKGMQQRLGLAVALAGDPEVLILDEPTSAMDPLGRYHVTELLKTLRHSGKTIFLNSHLLNDLEGLCDRVALIQGGKIQQVGDLTALLVRRPEWRITVGPVSEAARDALGPLPGVRLEGDTLWFQGERDTLPALHRSLAAHDVAVYEVVPVRDSLEAWFVQSLEGKEAAVDGTGDSPHP